jgi:transposase
MHRRLDAELIQKAYDLARLGLSNKSIARGCGISQSTFYEWKKAGEENPGTLYAELSEAIRRGSADGEEELVNSLKVSASNGSERAASWLLTHSPKHRETWSDAAATRKEVTRVLGSVVDAIRNSNISLDDQRDLLLALQAQGLAGDQQIEA